MPVHETSTFYETEPAGDQFWLRVLAAENAAAYGGGLGYVVNHPIDEVMPRRICVPPAMIASEQSLNNPVHNALRESGMTSGL